MNRIATRQVGTSAAQNYSSDANGNQCDNGKYDQSFWDSQNRMVFSHVEATDRESRYVYGADGLRRKVSAYQDGEGSPTTITHYGYDGTNVVREWSEDVDSGVKTVAATYLLGTSGAMYKRPSVAADVRWYVYDGLGSVVGEVDVSGTMLATKKHDVYGVARAGGTGTAKSKHGWQGGVGHFSDDETGLVYMRARYYDPALGRFISQDPALDGFNWFAYCNSDPINRFDPDGKSAKPWEDSDIMKIAAYMTAIIALSWLSPMARIIGVSAFIMTAMLVESFKLNPGVGTAVGITEGLVGVCVAGATDVKGALLSLLKNPGANVLGESAKLGIGSNITATIGCYAAYLQLTSLILDHT